MAWQYQLRYKFFINSHCLGAITLQWVLFSDVTCSTCIDVNNIANIMQMGREFPCDEVDIQVFGLSPVLFINIVVVDVKSLSHQFFRTKPKLKNQQHTGSFLVPNDCL